MRRERQLGWVTADQQLFAGPTAANWLDAVKRGICPFCGEGPFTVVCIHTAKKHGVERRELCDLLGINFTREQLCDPIYSKACAAIMGQKLRGARPGRSPAGAPRQFSDAAKKRLRAESAARAERHLDAVRDRDAEIVRLIKERRFTYAEIAERTGVHNKTVANVARRYNLPPRPGAQPQRPRRLCSIEGCERVHKAHGLCKLHWRRKQRAPLRTAP